MAVTAGARGSFGATEYAKALINILENFAAERDRLQSIQHAILNVLDDFHGEKARLEAMQRAVLNVLEDFGVEKTRLEDTQRAVLNILEDLAVEKNHLEESKRDVLRSEQAIRASLREKEVLLREIHHRVKNNLQVTSSLLRLQSAYIEDPQARAMFSDSQNRIRSMALVHEKLYQSNELSRIDLADYVRSLARLLLRSYSVQPHRVALTVSADPVFLSIETAVPCGLILNELLSNALKHAFPEGVAGEITVTVQKTGPGRATISVRDDGIGLPPDLDIETSDTLGLQMVRMLVEQLHGRVEVANGPGAEFRITLEEM